MCPYFHNSSNLLNGQQRIKMGLINIATGPTWPFDLWALDVEVVVVAFSNITTKTMGCMVTTSTGVIATLTMPDVFYMKVKPYQRAQLLTLLSTRFRVVPKELISKLPLLSLL